MVWRKYWLVSKLSLKSWNMGHCFFKESHGQNGVFQKRGLEIMKGEVKRLSVER